MSADHSRCTWHCGFNVLSNPLSPSLSPRLPLSSWAGQGPRRTAGPACPRSSCGSRVQDKQSERACVQAGGGLPRFAVTCVSVCTCEQPDGHLVHMLFTHLQGAVQWVLVHAWRCATVTSSHFTFSSPQKEACSPPHCVNDLSSALSLTGVALAGIRLPKFVISCPCVCTAPFSHPASHCGLSSDSLGKRGTLQSQEIVHVSLKGYLTWDWGLCRVVSLFFF